MLLSLVVLLHELDGDTVFDDEGDPETVWQGFGRDEDVLAFDGSFDILHLEGEVRRLLKQLRHRTVGFEAKPLNAIRVAIGIGDVKSRGLAVVSVLLDFSGGDADVVKSHSSPLWNSLFGSQIWPGALDLVIQDGRASGFGVDQDDGDIGLAAEFP